MRLVFHFNKYSLNIKECPAWIIRSIFDNRNDIAQENNKLLKGELIEDQGNIDDIIKEGIMSDVYGHEKYFIDEIRSEVPFRALSDPDVDMYIAMIFPKGVLYMEGDLTIVEEEGKQVAYVKPSQNTITITKSGDIQELIKPVQWIL